MIIGVGRRHPCAFPCKAKSLHRLLSQSFVLTAARWATTAPCHRLAFSESQYNGTMDRWATYARVLSLAQQTHNLTVKGVLAYLSQ